MCFTPDEKQELLGRIGNLETKIEEIFPIVKKEMQDAEFWGMLWVKLKEAKSLMQWIVGLIVVFLALTGQIKTALVSWLAIK